MPPLHLDQLRDRRFLAAVAGAVTLVALAVLRKINRAQDALAGSLIDKLEDVGQRVTSKDTENEEKDQSAEYDVIIIGGGTAGCVLASRITEDPKIRVLLLEAGQSGLTLPSSRIPIAYSALMRTAHLWDLWTEPQAQAGGKKCYWPRAKLLGGCSSINAMMFQLGSPSDFDEWASIGGDDASSWRWDEFQKYFLKFEKFVPHKLFPNVDVSIRGNAGPVEVGYFGYFANVSSNFLDACKGVGIPVSHDFNTSAGTLGASKIMTYIDSKGRRVSTESAYLTPDVLKRPNLKVAVSTTVTRILFDTSGPSPRAIGAEFCRGPNEPIYRAKATREVVLSAGTIHTPHILMLSGVGPAKELTAHSVPVVADIPGVGSHLMDHPVVNLRLRIKPGESLSYLRPLTFQDKIRTMAAFAQYNLLGTGPLTSNVGEAAAFVRSDDPALFPSPQYGPIEDATSGPGCPDLELFVSPSVWTEHGIGPVPNGSTATVSAYLVRPTSLGYISLRSNNPFDAPIIDPRYLTSQHDVDVLVRGVKLLLRILQTEPLASLLVSDDDVRLDHRTHELDDAALAALVRERVETIYHPTSTARMAPRAAGGVVDAELRVHGVTGLRIVDASIFPTTVSGHTAAACIATAEKAADLIKAAVQH